MAQLLGLLASSFIIVIIVNVICVACHNTSHGSRWLWRRKRKPWIWPRLDTTRLGSQGSHESNFTPWHCHGQSHSLVPLSARRITHFIYTGVQFQFQFQFQFCCLRLLATSWNACCREPRRGCIYLTSMNINMSLVCVRCDAALPYGAAG